MPLHFQARAGSSYDAVSGMVILVSRILPTELPDGSEGTEYQYALYRNDERIGRLGFLGADEVIESDGRREHVFFLDLGHDWLVEDMLSLKKKIASPGDDFQFLQQLSQGLVLAWSGETHNRDDLRCVAVTTVAALAACGVLVSDESPVSAQGTIVLAQVAIAGHLAEGGVTRE